MFRSGHQHPELCHTSRKLLGHDCRHGNRQSIQGRICRHVGEGVRRTRDFKSVARRAPREPPANNDCFCGVPGQYWFTGEYLNWQTSGAHLPPMVSALTGPNEDIPVTLFGDRDIRDGNHEGYRMDFGMWLDCCHCWGIEADYFDITGKQDSYDSGFSDGYTNGVETPITRIVFDPLVGSLVPDYVAYTGTTVGRITVDTNDYFSRPEYGRRQLRAYEWSANGHDVNWTDSPPGRSAWTASWVIASHV